MEQNKVKPDTILKNFWRNNHHFADLFNAALFDGKQVLKPDDLTEVDTDVSSLIKFNGHAETVQKILDVVKKTAYGVDFVLWGLENQATISTCKSFNASKDVTVKNLMKVFSLSEEDAADYVEKYW